MPAIAQPTATRRRLLQATVAAATLAATHPAWIATLRAQDAATSDLVAGNTAFALDLYDAIRNESDDNLLISPLSISLALAMTWAGARGDTATRMAATLGFQSGPETIAPAFRALVDDLVARGTADDDPDNDVTARTLHIANALWGEQSFPFSDTFTGALEADYGADLHEVDFAGAPDDAREEINTWIEDETEGRIEDIVPAGAITPETRLVLANAIWFYGSWQHPFEPDRTEDGEFTRLDGSTVEVPFMHGREDLLYAGDEGYQAVEIPYAGSGFAMTVLLPDDGTFEDFEADLDSATLTGILDGMGSTEVRLAIPRFEFEFDTSLAGPLQGLGMTDAFSDRADFSGMVDDPGADPIAISDVLHKAFISVDEEGTEAAAATVVILEATSAMPEEPVVLTIDRPFLFAIRDTETGTLLFLGRVLDPS